MCDEAMAVQEENKMVGMVEEHLYRSSICSGKCLFDPCIPFAFQPIEPKWFAKVKAPLIKKYELAVQPVRSHNSSHLDNLYTEYRYYLMKYTQSKSTVK